MPVQIKKILRFLLSLIAAFIARFTILSKMPNPDIDNASILVAFFIVFYQIALMFVIFFIFYFIFSVVLKIEVSRNKTVLNYFGLFKIVLALVLGAVLWELIMIYLIKGSSGLAGMILGPIEALFWGGISFGISFFIIRLIFKNKNYGKNSNR